MLRHVSFILIRHTTLNKAPQSTVTPKYASIKLQNKVTHWEEKNIALRRLATSYFIK
jgi:hypothetical protein